MHPTSIRSEFLRLRVTGLSLASIGRQLRVSKPTLIKWNRQCQSEINFQKVADQQRVLNEVTASADQELADLTRRLTAVKQELFSRAMREIPTAALETIAGQFRQRIESLQSAKHDTAPPSVAPSDGERVRERGKSMAIETPIQIGLAAPEPSSEGVSAPSLQDSTTPPLQSPAPSVESRLAEEDGTCRVETQ